jgi:hypothetical protein
MEGPSISAEDFEDAMSKLLPLHNLDALARRPLEDHVFDRVSFLLTSVGKPAWSVRPRTYVLLRMIGRVDCMATFVLEGLLDIALPYTERNLPSGLQSLSSRHLFISRQVTVLSKANDLEIEGGRHRHFCKFEVFHTISLRKSGWIFGTHVYLAMLLKLLSCYYCTIFQLSCREQVTKLMNVVPWQGGFWKLQQLAGVKNTYGSNI